MRTVPRRNYQARGFWSANRGPNWCFLRTDTRFCDAFGMKTFFFGDHLFSAEKTAWNSDFGRKIPLSFCSSPCLFDPDWDKFLVPLSNSHKINFSCPPQNLFLFPPVTLSWRRAWTIKEFCEFNSSNYQEITQACLIQLLFCWCSRLFHNLPRVSCKEGSHILLKFLLHLKFFLILTWSTGPVLDAPSDESKYLPNSSKSQF